MSNRSASYRQETNSRGFRGKTQKKFVPKNPPISSLPNTTTTANPTLSASLRQSISGLPSNSGSGSGSGRQSRVRLGDNGEWVSSKTQRGCGGGNFVNYLPQDEAVAVGLSAEEGGLDAVESQRVVDLLNRELAMLLKLKPRDFWRQVAADASLHEFLDSFLKFRSRWYDFPYHGTKGVVAGVIVGDLELSRRVFMVLYRISSNRDPGVPASDSLSQKDHEDFECYTCSAMGPQKTNFHDISFLGHSSDYVSTLQFIFRGNGLRSFLWFYFQHEDTHDAREMLFVGGYKLVGPICKTDSCI